MRAEILIRLRREEAEALYEEIRHETYEERAVLAELARALKESLGH